MNAQALEFPLPAETLRTARHVVANADQFDDETQRDAVTHLMTVGDFMDHARAKALQDRFELEDMVAQMDAEGVVAASEYRSLTEIAVQVPLSDWLRGLLLILMIPAAFVVVKA
ncbi:MAG: hypothetical protein ACSHXB_03950 [Sulfitobacter sp.]